MTRFAAAHRYEPFWMKPAVGTRFEEIPAETQLLFLELPDDRIALLVPLAGGPGNPWRCSLQSESGAFCLVVDSGNRPVPDSLRTGDFPALYIGVSPRGEFHSLLKRSARTVAEVLGSTLREEKSLPAFIDDFGWCTWDAFYQEVSHEKVREGLDSFRAIGIPPRFLVLDDGWQCEESFGEDRGRRLTALAPNFKFGHDLCPTVRMAKEEFDVRTILVWHAFQGYWGGVSPQHLPAYAPQEIARSYCTGILHYLPEANSKWWGTTAGIIPPTHIAQFFSDYHRLLAGQGIDGVKVDNQAALEAFAEIENVGRTALYAAYHDALEASVSQHFSRTQPLINCMSCANDLLYACKQSALTRTSGDFYPQHPHVQGLHLWTNAFVATWFGHFIHPDWDMFHSKHAHASFHAAARAISGGPVYVSDKPGQHDAYLLRKLVLSDGSVLRCDHPAMLTADVLFTDPTREDVPLKIWNTTRRGGVGVLGLFNCRHEPEREIRISLTYRASDVPDLPNADHYAIYQHRAQSVQSVTRVEPMSVTLAQIEWELVTIVPINRGTAVIGLLDKFMGSAAVLDEHRQGNTLRLRLRDGGTLGIYTQYPPTRVLAGTSDLPFHYQGTLLTVFLETPGDQQIELYWNAPNLP